MEEKKQSFKRAEFSMGQLDYERYHLLFLKADEIGVKLRTGYWSALWELKAVLTQIFLNFSPILQESSLKRDIDDAYENLNAVSNGLPRNRNYATEEQKKRYNIARQMVFDFDMQLRIIKQNLGLGIPVEQSKTNKQKSEQAISE